MRSVHLRQLSLWFSLLFRGTTKALMRRRITLKHTQSDGLKEKRDRQRKVWEVKEPIFYPSTEILQL